MRLFPAVKAKNIILKSIFEETKLKFVTFLDANTTHLKLHMHWSWVDIFKTGYRSISLSIWITFRQNNVAARLGSRSSITFFPEIPNLSYYFFPNFTTVAVHVNEPQSGERKRIHFLPKTPQGKISPFPLFIFLYIFLLLLSPLLGMENLPGRGSNSRKEGYFPSLQSVREI